MQAVEQPRKKPDKELAKRIAEVSAELIGVKKPRPRGEAMFLVKTDGSFSQVGSLDAWGNAEPGDVKVIVPVVSKEESFWLPSPRKPIQMFWVRPRFDMEKKEETEMARHGIINAARKLVDAGVDGNLPCELRLGRPLSTRNEIARDIGEAWHKDSSRKAPGHLNIPGVRMFSKLKDIANL